MEVGSTKSIQKQSVLVPCSWPPEHVLHISVYCRYWFNSFMDSNREDFLMVVFWHRFISAPWAVGPLAIAPYGSLKPSRGPWGQLRWEASHILRHVEHRFGGCRVPLPRSKVPWCLLIFSSTSFGIMFPPSNHDILPELDPLASQDSCWFALGRDAGAFQFCTPRGLWRFGERSEEGESCA